MYEITPTLKLFNLNPPFPGYNNFLGAYLFCGEQKAIIDVGPRAVIPGLISKLKQLGINPEEIDYIILTHIHIDHAGGIGTAVKEMGRARVIAHKRAIPHLIDPSLLWQASRKTLGKLALNYGEIEAVAADRIMPATDNMELDLGGDLVLEIILTPGHAPHHLSLFDRASGILIAGEAAGVCVNGTIRPATPPPFKLEETMSSIDRLISLEPRKICYGHFGCYDNAHARLRAIREQLLTWYEIISREAVSGKNTQDIFTLLRDKDGNLGYLDSLSRNEYDREYILLINSVRGIYESILKPG